MLNDRVTANLFFDAWSDSGAQANAVLCEGCEVPPSFEVFEYGLEITRKRAQHPIGVEQYARTLADSYERPQ
jgi:hypothetical protein